MVQTVSFRFTLFCSQTERNKILKIILFYDVVGKFMVQTVSFRFTLFCSQTERNKILKIILFY